MINDISFVPPNARNVKLLQALLFRLKMCLWKSFCGAVSVRGMAAALPCPRNLHAPWWGCPRYIWTVIQAVTVG